MLAAQTADGYWHYAVENKVSVGAHDLLAREFLGVRTARETAGTAAWIRSCQSGDGGWPNFHGGPDDLPTTVMAYTALRLAGDAPDRPHMRAAADRIARLGGLERCRNSTRLWLALAGLWPWEKVRTLPPELFLLPRHAPVSLHEVGCWARQTIVAVSVLGALRPVWPVAFDLAELPDWKEPGPRIRRRRSPRGPLRRRALAAMRAWMVQRQDADGCWGAGHSVTVCTLLALLVLGEPPGSPLVRSAVRGLETFADDDGPMRRVRFSHSPVWDTAHVVLALRAAGLPASHPALSRAAAWLLDRQCDRTGDWAVHRPGLQPGGWSFQFANAHYPDCDDTALVVRALRAVASSTAREDGAVVRGVRWLSGMACKDGGWAAFDADLAVGLLRRLRITDANVLLLDGTTADVTAHAVETLADEGPRYARTVQAGADWLLRAQENDGSWYGRWGCNHVYGTGAALPALRAAGLRREHLAIRRGVAWLLDHQNPDGGWGEDHRSYLNPSWRGRGESTASQTAWALQGLLSAGVDGTAVLRAVDWLVRRQLPDGTWQEAQYTGTGMPWRAPIRYRSYPIVFPVLALTQYLKEPKNAT
ncbi:squalene--hopene cyclase [Streptomyces formicae]|uniref:Squalene--hopene cyclase n=2 Tax=Streptomyces formicae TaxID=1616117 RepID=A0ABY3WZ26_9ACTN|nr:squalene--hopene cyclase [Streptomyces formicae]